MTYDIRYVFELFFSILDSIIRCVERGRYHMAVPFIRFESRGEHQRCVVAESRLVWSVLPAV